MLLLLSSLFGSQTLLLELGPGQGSREDESFIVTAQEPWWMSANVLRVQVCICESCIYNYWMAVTESPSWKRSPSGTAKYRENFSVDVAPKFS